MALIIKNFTFAAGATIIASEHNDNYDTIFNEINGSLDNANISASADIAGSKLDLTSSAVAVSTTNLATAYLLATNITVTNLEVSTIHASTGNPTGTDGQVLANSSGSNTTWTNSGGVMGTFNIDISTTGAQTVTGVGFEPKGVYFFTSEQNANEPSFGVDTVTTRLSSFFNAQGAVWTSSSSFSIVALDSGGANFSANISSTNSDGFILHKQTTGSPTGTKIVGYIAL